MIGTRLAAALSLILSITAVALAVAALMASLRDDDAGRGRVVQTRLLPSDEPPVLFPLDEFYASTGAEGRLRALYVYPPGFHGHNRGCKVVWVQDAGADSAGVFADPCGGARFDRDGVLLSGPADRGLDEFKTEPGIEGVIADTRTLFCGVAASQSTAPTMAQPTLEAATATTPIAVVTPPGVLVATSTASPTPSASPTVTATPSPEGVEREECDRVSPDGG